MAVAVKQPAPLRWVRIVAKEEEPRAIAVLDQFSGGKLLRHTLAPNVASDLARVVED